MEDPDPIPWNPCPGVVSQARMTPMKPILNEESAHSKQMRLLHKFSKFITQPSPDGAEKFMTDVTAFEDYMQRTVAVNTMVCHSKTHTDTLDGFMSDGKCYFYSTRHMKVGSWCIQVKVRLIFDIKVINF